MTSDFEIGRVVSVDTAQVTIELNRDLKALSRATYEGPQEIGQINSYIILPVGARRLVAMITKVVLAEQAEINADRTMVTLPSARRIMKATLIGTIDGNAFTQGVSIFPVLDNTVHLATAEDLNVIFDGEKRNSEEKKRVEKPGFCIQLGESPIFKGYPIQIDPDAFFGKHAAVLGSTGSGKSCTIASLIQEILEQKEVRQTNIVILDTNSEYRTAFQKRNKDGTWENIGERRYLYIPSDPRNALSRLVIPYWFLNADDYVRLFRAREGLQSPVLLRALRLARAGEADTGGVATVIESLRISCEKILNHSLNTVANQQYFIPKNIKECCEDSLRYPEKYPQHIENLNQQHGTDVFSEFKEALETIQGIAEEAENGQLGTTRIQQISDAITPVIARLNEIAASGSDITPHVTADQPLYFDRNQFLESALQTSMKEQVESGNPGRVRDACGPMFLRIRRFFEDPRFEFLFGRYPSTPYVLASFIRDVLGLESTTDNKVTLSSREELPFEKLPFYDRQRMNSEAHHVVILDLSLLSSEVLENVTALIGRLILEFLQRLGELGGEKTRGSLPVVLVLEEAQNYIREQRYNDDESIARNVFERIAREGRKHGLGLVVSSQRPSELSKTVLSQCSSFIVHRLQNPEDLRYFKEIVPATYGPLMEQLPALAPQTALVLGECVRAPVIVKIREAHPLPRSRDPKFYKYWVEESPQPVPVEEVCSQWEGRK